MNLNEAKRVLIDAGYLVERISPRTQAKTDDNFRAFMRGERFSPEHETHFDYQMSGNNAMDLIRAGRPTKTYNVLAFIYDNNGEVSSVDLRNKMFNGNMMNMRTWASNNSKYVTTNKANGRRSFSLTKAGKEAIINAIEVLGD
jgi:hypothetical protein